MDNLQQVMKFLEENVDNPDFAVCRDEAVVEIKKLSSPQGAIGPLLDFMSSHPDLDYGMPGAFVHFIETFGEEAYVDFLITDIRKQPTEHNTWMLLRIMNTWKSPRQAEYVEVMREALMHPQISAAVKETVEEDLKDFED